MKCYERYRQGSDRWFPAVPEDWVDVPIWTMFTRDVRKGHADETLLSVYRDYGVVPKDSRDDNKNTPSEDLSTYQLVEPGDLVVNKMKAWQGSLSISGWRGIVSPAYFVYRPHHGADERFLHYLLRSRPLIAAYIGMSKGVRPGQWDLEPQSFSRLKVALPPLDEQRAIANYLDREMARIDTLIEEQERLIEMLRSRRQCAIAQAVTKGVDPSAELKDSGVNWIGKTVASWDVQPVRAAMLESDTRNVGAANQDYLSLMANVGVIPYAEKGDVGNKKPEDLSKCKLVRKNDFVINSMNYQIGSYGVSRYDGVCSPVYIVIQHKPEVIELGFALRVFETPAFQKFAQSFGNGILEHRRSISWGTLKNLPIPIPPVREQRRILTYLDEQTAKIDTLIAETETFIEIVRERRSALITAAVTGQIDVREVA